MQQSLLNTQDIVYAYFQNDTIFYELHDKILRSICISKDEILSLLSYDFFNYGEDKSYCKNSSNSSLTNTNLISLSDSDLFQIILMQDPKDLFLA